MVCRSDEQSDPLNLLWLTKQANASSPKTTNTCTGFDLINTACLFWHKQALTHVLALELLRLSK